MLAVEYYFRQIPHKWKKSPADPIISSLKKRSLSIAHSGLLSSHPSNVNQTERLRKICFQYEKRNFHSSHINSLLSPGVYDEVDGSGYSWLKEENKFTRKVIESRLEQSDINIESLQDEIISASSYDGQPTKELGPSGKYKYWSIDDAKTGIRTFWRQSSSSSSSSSGEDVELVLKIDFQKESLVGNMSLSVNEEFVAFITCPISLDNPILNLRHIPTGQQHKFATSSLFADNHFQNLDNVEFGIGQESLQLYVSTLNPSGRPHAVFSLDVNINNLRDDSKFNNGTITLGQPSLLFQEDSDEFFVNIQRSKGCQHMIVSSTGKTSNEIYLIDSSLSMKLVKQRQEGIQYYVDCDCNENVFLLAHRFPDNSKRNHASTLGIEMSLFQAHTDQLPLTNLDGFGTALYLDPSHQKHSLQSHSNREVFFIEEMDLFHSHIVLYQRSNIDGRQQIMIGSPNYNFMDSHKIIPLPDEYKWASIRPGGNMYYYSDICSFHLETPILPEIQFDYHLGQAKLINSPKHTLSCNDSRMRDALDSKGIEISRKLVPSYDKVEVPMTILTPSNCTGSVILVGYGSYGQNIPMQYDPTLVPYLKRGIAIAYAHTRGGGELGKSWYQAGRLDNKQNTIEDYIACAQELKKTFPQIVGKGFSAGGIPVGRAAFTLRNRQAGSDDSGNDEFLFQAVSLTNAFLDIMKSMTITNHFLTQHEWEEFGNPSQDESIAKYIEKYSPYQNIPHCMKDPCPHVLVIGSLDDHHVPYWNSTSFSTRAHNSIVEQKKVKDTNYAENCDTKRVLLHMEGSGGHQLHGTRLEVASLEAAFLLGITRIAVKNK